MIFIDNKYTYWYYNIINRAKTRDISGYTEKHHIIPKSCGGTNSKNNLVRLTAKEHFICHWLLTKMTEGNYKSKMVFALRCMQTVNKNQMRYSSKITSKVYAGLKGKAKHTPETKQKIKEKRATQDMSYCRGKARSDETKQKIKEKRATQDMSYRKGVPMSEDQKQKISNTLKGNTPWNKGKPGTGFGNPLTNPMRDPELIKKMLETRRINKEKKLLS